MIEVATGVAFLMSSLYGANMANAQATETAAAPTTGQATSTEARALKTPREIEAYVREIYADRPILVDIARCESTFRQFNPDGTVIRGMVNNLDVGVMQINEKYHAEMAGKLGYDIYTIEGNLGFARYLYGKYGTDPWVSSAKCWKTGELAMR